MNAENRTITVVIIFVNLLLPFFQVSGQSQQTEYRFHTCSPDGGFYYDGVMAIQQDASGFIWTLTRNDLYRFDGHQHVSYYHYFRNLNPEDNWYFRQMATDTLGRLYLLANNKLFVHHANTNHFECLTDSTVSFFRIDNKGLMWLNINSLQYLYQPETGTFILITFNDRPITNLSFFWHDDGQLYGTSSWGTIYRIDPESGECTIHVKIPQELPLVHFAFKDKTFWTANRNTLFRLDIETNEVTSYNFLDAPRNIVTTLHIDQLQNLWIGTRRGLYLFDMKTEAYSLFLINSDDPFSIPNNSIWTISEDRQQNIWIGTYSGGLCYYNPKEKNHFKSYLPKETGVNNPVVSGFAETEKELFVATEGGGINVINRKTGTFSYKMHSQEERSLSHNNVKSMLPDSTRNNLWIGMFTGGLDCYHIPTQTFTNYKNVQGDDNSLKVNNIRKLVHESDSGFWIAYQSRELLLSYFSFEHQTIQHFSTDGLSDNDYIFDICRGTADDLWIVTHNKLYRMNIIDKEWIEVASQGMINGQSLYVDSEHNVWIGTVGKGLIKYSARDSTFHYYDDILTFKALTIYSICPDRYGFLWLGSDNGLFRFDPKTGVFMQFTKDDGVQGVVFYPLASMQSSTGELYFGGTAGFTIVADSDIPINTYKPNAMISDILINNVSILFPSLITRNIWVNDELTLKHDQSNIGFWFSSDNYLMPAKNRFKYRLVGYDNRWVETDASNRYAFFTKLPAGQYTFELIASNNDRMWNENATRLKIRVLPHPMLSAWAYTLYTLVAFLTLFIIFRYYHRQRQLKMALYKESLEKRQREEIHQSQLSFFTNISHELKTPLSLILAVTDTLRKNGLDDFYLRILNNNAQRLYHLINELMQFRKVECGKQTLHLEMIDMNAFVLNISDDFLDFSRQHRMNYDIQTDEALPKKVPADRKILEKIVINLLNNAFRYTPEGGAISLCIYSDIRPYSPSYRNSFHIGNGQIEDPFYIVVRDTGIGISESSIHKIFERFYKVDENADKHLGSGIGLALVKSLIVLHKGSITVYSEREKGTEMVVALSKNTTNYGEQDFAQPNLSDVDLLPVMAQLSENHRTEIKNNELYLRENKRILIAEDNDDLRKLTADFLSPYYDVLEASDGIAASSLIRDMEVDLIISDIMMPLKDGISLCREIKSDMSVSHIPLIMLTAKIGQESKLEGVESGADVYLEKPVNFDILLQVIRNIFKQQDSLKEHYAKNYFAESGEISANKHSNAFLKKLYEILEANFDNDELDVNMIAAELSMSRSKLYAKLKTITDKPLMEIVLNYRLKKAAKLLIEENLSIGEIIMRVGIESQSYFTRMFKKEFGETPTAFAAKNKSKSN